MTGEIAHKGDKAPIQAGQRWHVERTNAWHNGSNRLQHCYERREDIIGAFFDLADAIITVRRLIRESGDIHADSYRVLSPASPNLVTTCQHPGCGTSSRTVAATATIRPPGPRLPPA
jgi:hypothetical protein